MPHISMKILMIVMFFITGAAVNAHAQASAPVNIEFEPDSNRIDLLTEKNLPDYKEAEKGSFRFFTGRLDEPLINSPAGFRL